MQVMTVIPITSTLCPWTIPKGCKILQLSLANIYNQDHSCWQWRLGCMGWWHLLQHPKSCTQPNPPSHWCITPNRSKAWVLCKAKFWRWKMLILHLQASLPASVISCLITNYHTLSKFSKLESNTSRCCFYDQKKCSHGVKKHWIEKEKKKKKKLSASPVIALVWSKSQDPSLHEKNLIFQICNEISPLVYTSQN